MKWLPAKKANQLIMVLVCLTLGASYGTWSIVGQFEPESRVKSDMEFFFQLGLYDLKSLQKEIYDTTILITKEQIQSTITSPNDSRFMFKGQVIQRDQDYFGLNPIHYATPPKELMMDDVVNWLTQSQVKITILKKKPLMISRSGEIILY